ncbi:thioredoxin family protein [Thalassoglobus polymorphus]|uniref:Thioredoxin n=1 Tax=Thalassoglobus polymorphus TaxID=2527994 RepID=A0A517QHB1_9PLAN|nr:thioredoxin family protein [Thalassoglobus polymorphus]QDT31010.1 Thioredoxin [Thalassoglobus polymorphus]
MNSKQISTKCWPLVFALLLSPSTLAENFTCADPAIAIAAEKARLESAIFWTGSPLPGDWFRPCPISVRNAQHSGGGVTRFRFENGEVFDWSMTLEGPHALLLRDVIPHEVDHAVRASLVRHPIERWLDEGCATLFESEEVKNSLREAALKVPSEAITKQWLSDLDYPQNPEAMATVYSIGFSLVEYLLTLAPPPTLLEFQRIEAPIESRLISVYKVTIPEFRANWEEWRTKPSQIQIAFRCQCRDQSKPLLIVWTAKWCANCRQFSHAWDSNSSFRAELQNAFHIHVLDYDQHRDLAIRHNIQHLPTFQTRLSRIIGFESKTSLLSQLLEPTEPLKKNSDKQDSHPESGKTQNSNTESENAVSSDAKIAPPEETLSDEIQSKEKLEQEPKQKLSESAKPETAQPSRFQWLKNWIPVSSSFLYQAGILSGTAASGGLAGFALAVLPRLLARRKTKIAHASKQSLPSEERSVLISKVPFPRQLDEASELLAIRQSEGRVAVLDALRGMFLDDELEKITSTADEKIKTALTQLKSSIDQRVDEVAPLSTRVEANTNDL